MTVRRALLSALAVLCTGPWLASCATSGAPSAGDPERPADAVIYARVLTMDPTNPKGKGLAIRNGQIVEVSSPAALRRLVGPETRIFNWSNRTVVPGLIDTHVDLLALGESMVGLDLSDSAGMEDVAGRVRAVLAERGVGEQRWVVGYGWEEHRFSDNDQPSRAALDAAAPGRPILLHRADRRAALASGEALRLADLDERASDPPGGRLGRRADGSLDGLLYGRAVELVSRLVPPHPPEVRRALLQAALTRLAEVGYTTVHDQGGDAETWRELQGLAAANLLPLRVYETVSATDPELPQLLAAGPQIGLAEHQLTLRAVRLDLDGELGARTALLLTPYGDSPQQKGLELSSNQELTELAQRCYRAGFQLIVHASGDAAVRRSLDVLETLLPTWSHWDAVRPRLEGADLVDPLDAPRFGLTHLVASVQPTRVARQMHWLLDRLDEERLDSAHAWRALEQGGAILTLGSGAPELPPDPRTVFIAAVSREDESGWPAGGWKPAQRLTAAEALRSLTLNGAYAGFEEQLKGSLRPAKFADLTVFNRDLLLTDLEDLHRLKVLGTLVGGKIRYRTRYLR